ncbi:MAG: hypothetical protein ACJAUD_001463 [Crocinitomicaceae bacterium]|jgi:hypothetical protein
MIKHNLALILSLTCSIAFSQDNLRTIDVDWKKGDSRSIAHKGTTTIYIEDTIFQSTEVNTIYTIEVLAANKGYILKYTSKSYDIDVNKSDSLVKDIVTEMMTLIAEQMEDFEYKLIFDPEQGIITEMINEDKFFKLFQTLMKKFGEESELIPDDKRETFNKYMTERLPNMKDQYIQTVINGANLLIQGYSYAFIPDDMYTTESIYYEVDAMTHGNIELPSMMTIGSTLSDETISVNTSMDVDKLSMIEFLQESGKGQDLSVSNFEMIIESNYDFSASTTWMQKYESFTSIDISNTVKVVMKEEAIFTEN